MSRKKEVRILVGDFETTVFDQQEYTEVWASGLAELWKEEAIIFHSIADTLEHLYSLRTNIILYYHNLKFDGTFWLDYLINKLGYKQAYHIIEDEPFKCKWMNTSEMPNNSFKYSISDMGQWYTLTIKHNHKIIEIRDSLKLLPFSLREIGKAYKTKHQKLEMEYKGFRYSGCTISPEEEEYLKCDLYVLKEALEILFSQGHNKLTIGSCCLSEYKELIGGRELFREMFPNLSEIKIDKEVYGSANADEYIRKSYKGGWCYLVKGRENRVVTNGVTVDVNSLYPSVMHSESGNIYPYGLPHFWSGDYLPPCTQQPNIYWFVRIRTRFKLRDGRLPCIQIKGNWRYPPTEWLSTSDVFNPRDNKYYSEVKDKSGNVVSTFVDLTLTMTDFRLISEHYDLIDCRILDGCYFSAEVGLFDDYINKYREIKINSTGALRTTAKLFLNNLYGKFATSTNSSFKVAYVRDDKSISFFEVTENDKESVYIPIGSAITSYARDFTIRHAQQNYYGADKRGFIYADTDSIHCDLSVDELKEIAMHDHKFCCWKVEAKWDRAIFVRQKTYIEHVTHVDLKEVPEFYSIKCAGMPEKCKKLIMLSFEGRTPENQNEWDNLADYEKEFVSVKRDITDFKRGLKVSGKLMPRRIQGGTILVDTDFEIR